MNPKRQVIEQAIYDLEENVKTVYEIWKQSLESGITDRERDAMMETYYERRNIANRLFHDWTKVNPNSAYYDPNPTPIFSSSDFYGPNALQKLKPRTYPIILGAATMSVEHAFQTIRRTKKFIEQLRTKLKKRKDLQESSPFQLTEAKLKQMIMEALGQESLDLMLAHHGFEPYDTSWITQPTKHANYNSRSWFKGQPGRRGTVRFTLTYTLVDSILHYKIEGLSRRKRRRGTTFSIASGKIEIPPNLFLETEEGIREADALMLLEEAATIERALGMYE